MRGRAKTGEGSKLVRALTRGQIEQMRRIGILDDADDHPAP